MSTRIKLFFIGIANAFNPDGYSAIVQSPKPLGSLSHAINQKREETYTRILNRTPHAKHQTHQNA